MREDTGGGGGASSRCEGRQGTGRRQDVREDRRAGASSRCEGRQEGWGVVKM